MPTVLPGCPQSRIIHPATQSDVKCQQKATMTPFLRLRRAGAVLFLEALGVAPPVPCVQRKGGPSKERVQR